jgi:hypothetical protein
MTADVDSSTRLIDPVQPLKSSTSFYRRPRGDWTDAMTWTSTAVLALFLCAASALAGTEKEQVFITSIKSAKEVKDKLRTLVIENRGCPSGSCWVATGYDICYRIGALDVKLDYLLSADSSHRKATPQLDITEAELRHFQLMFAQCKLHNFPALLQVVYSPSKAAEKRINAWLGAASP